MKTLTPKELLFSAHYIQHWNGARAAIQSGYSANSATEIAYEILRKPHVKEFISVQLNEICEKTKVTTENVVNEISKLAFSNLLDCYDSDGQLIPIHELPRNVAAAITEVVETEFKGVKTRKYKMDGKSRNLELLGKYLQMFVEKIEIKTADDMYDSIRTNVKSSIKNVVKH